MGRVGGGVAMYVKKSINTTLIQSIEEKTEALWVTIETGEKAILRTGVIYRPPGQEEELDKNLLQDINKMALKGEVIIMGDFNLPDVNWEESSASSTRSRDILNSLQGASLKQLVGEPTRKDAILDLILTNGDRISDVHVGENLGSSDHQAVWFSIKTETDTYHTKTKVLDFRKADFVEMGECVSDSLVEWKNLKGVQEKWEKLKSAILKATDLCIKRVRKSTRKRKPVWFTKEVGSIVTAKKIAFRKYKQTQNNEDKEVYLARQKEAKKVIRCVKAQTEEKMAQSVGEIKYEGLADPAE